MTKAFAAPVVASMLALVGCSLGGQKPMPTVQGVDLKRFMGDWYVIANIPTFIERQAHNAVESYRLKPGGGINTTFRFRKGGFDGEQKQYDFRAVVEDEESNAVWKMQLVWPFWADYRIAYLNSEYTQTIIARESRDYVWIMARTPEIEQEAYEKLLSEVAQLGYDVELLQKVPHRW